MSVTPARFGPAVILAFLLVLLVTYGATPADVEHSATPFATPSADLGPDPCSDEHGGVHDGSVPDAARPAGSDDALHGPTPTAARPLRCLLAPALNSTSGPAVILAAASTVVRLRVLRRRPSVPRRRTASPGRRPLAVGPAPVPRREVSPLVPDA